ncbi:Pullulanase 1, chloroplastic [Linum grandiflorum]
MALELSSPPFLSTLSSSSTTTTPLLRLPNLPSHHRPLHSAHTSLHLPFRCFSTSLRYPLLRCSSSMPAEVSTAPSQVQLENCFLYSKAFWVCESVIAWNVDVGDGRCCLYASWTASLSAADDGIQGYDASIEIFEDSDGLPANVVEKFPHIRDYKAFRVPAGVDIKSLLKSQLAVAAFSFDGKCSNATGLQLPGILDEQFSYDGPLGACYSEDAVSLYLWAPTAQAVRACIYSDHASAEPQEVVELKEMNGVWSIVGPKTWEGCYYTYEVCVYHPSTLSIQKCYANDPYARGLSSDGQRTFLVDLGSNGLKPEGWDKVADDKPTIVSFSDITLYELHVRDFSAYDQTVDPDIRGGYLAFTLKDSAGVHHLKKLSNAGITHVHLLPTFHFAGVDDVKENWKSIDEKKLENLPPDSDEQQAQITAIQNNDGYNWGYNPVLWGVPKGSYASNPNGPTRITEFRKMVQALNNIGLRVVLDVVYNHLQGSGPFHVDSVLDKIVPGYYLRQNTAGLVEHSTCTNNTASEHYMVERLIIDDLLNWVVNYKVDGFRFDLMGHIMKRTMEKAKDALCSLTKEKDGIDGSSVYLYGEGWDFGEVSQNGRGINASQSNISGTGIGSFNDRIRDAVLGGSPFGHPPQQGFLTGLMLQPNGHDHGGRDNEEAMLATAKDHVQVGMAANLRDFKLIDHLGKKVTGSEILTYGGTPVAYASCPAETINYVSAHDNETLFDIVSLKTRMDISLDERCRINHLATSMIALSQGIPFFHAGDEILRSKSLDRDSYNSGDWFNRLDFTYNTNNWGVGLPPKEKNERSWPLIKPRLADPSFKPHREHILAAVQNFTDVLQIRYSSPLFRLPTAKAIQERVQFHNVGPCSLAGVIVMSIEDGHAAKTDLPQLDQIYSCIVVIYNAQPSEVSFTDPGLQSRNFQLHPVQVKTTDEVVKKSSYDASSGCFTIPSRTASVFVECR